MTKDILLTTGQGPKECALALNGILDILEVQASKAGLSCDVQILGEIKRPRSAIISLEGKNTYRFTQSWLGPILWRAQSPLRPQHKRKNWFINAIEIVRPSTSWHLDPKDIRYESFRAGGPGGQHQNTTDSAVRAVHIPSGLQAVSRAERSQHRNKTRALRQLENMFIAKEMENQAALGNDLHAQHHEIERGNPIRIFEGSRFKEKRISS
ncbi:UNVERIFIED_CONTAM: hypothetical protein GTU68_004265 [Idotea baltica]|nr:hypothetical protein [Idotea baltica]